MHAPPPPPPPAQDWLFIAAKRVSAVEYGLLLATFGLVMALGLEGGIAAGILLAALHFAYRCEPGSWRVLAVRGAGCVACAPHAYRPAPPIPAPPRPSHPCHLRSYSKVTMTAFTVVPSRSGAGACCMAWHGVAWHGRAGQGRAGQSMRQHGMAWPAMAWHTCPS